MSSALWLTLALPQWYARAVVDPFVGGAWTTIPAFGTLCLLVGTVLGWISRRGGLLLFLIPVLASHAFVGLSGALRGRVVDSAASALVLAFLCAQAVLAGYLIHRLAGIRTAATALALFSLSYAAAAALIATMALTDSWL